MAFTGSAGGPAVAGLEAERGQLVRLIRLLQQTGEGAEIGRRGVDAPDSPATDRNGAAPARASMRPGRGCPG